MQVNVTQELSPIQNFDLQLLSVYPLHTLKRLCEVYQITKKKKTEVTGKVHAGKWQMDNTLNNGVVNSIISVNVIVFTK